MIKKARRTMYILEFMCNINIQYSTINQHQQMQEAEKLDNISEAPQPILRSRQKLTVLIKLIRFLRMRWLEVLLVAIAFLLLGLLISSFLPSKIVFDKGLGLEQAAGQVQYYRIPCQYWKHRIQMLKAMGIRAISTYVVWNFHQLSPGKFDFESPQKNLTKFLQLCKNEDMKVWIRPGPYICSEWDFGGLPARMLTLKGIKIRSMNKVFMDEVKVWFNQLAPILKPFTGGQNPTIQLLQIQNEYSFNLQKDKTYINTLCSMWHKLGIHTQQYFVDVRWHLSDTYFDDAVIGVNSYITKSEFEGIQNQFPNNQIIASEVYSGWIVYWGQPLNVPNITQVAQHTLKQLTLGIPFDIYLGSGGTNFGLGAGAGQPYQPHQTSYDWGAPINQHGAPTFAYYVIRQIIKQFYINKYINHYNPEIDTQILQRAFSIPPVPQENPLIEIPNFSLKIKANLMDSMGSPFLKDMVKLPIFQQDELRMYHQGIVVYQTHLPKGSYVMEGKFRDFSTVWVNGEFNATADRNLIKELWDKQTVQFLCPLQNNTVRIMVEAMGHIGFGRTMFEDVKGIIDWKMTQLGKKVQPRWNVYPIHLNVTSQLFKFDKINKEKPQNYPSLRIADLVLNQNQIGDTFLDMSNFKKGYVWVNDYNLGRYWEKGPQKKIYCPGPWLKKGTNRIVVLQLLPVSQNATIFGSKKSDREQKYGDK